jgi:hypothetical protein
MRTTISNLVEEKPAPQSAEPLRIAFRPAVGSDVRYLKHSWLKSFRDGEGVKDIPNSVYFFYEERILQHIIPRCSNQGGVIIAYENDFIDDWHHIVEKDILGYIVCEPFEDRLLVHMCYVRGYDKEGKAKGKQYRRQGIGTALLEEAMRKFKCPTNTFFYTYRTKMCWEQYEFRKKLKERGAKYVLYPKFSLLPRAWETGQTPEEVERR